MVCASLVRESRYMSNAEVTARRSGIDLRRIAVALGESFKVQWVLFVVPLVYLATNAFFLRNIEDGVTAPVLALLIDLITAGVPTAIASLFLLRFVQYAFIIKPESLPRAFGQDLMLLVREPSRLLVGVPAFAAMILFNKAMIELKPSIPHIMPFSWDEAFMKLDRMLHFGIDPWRILQPVMGHDWVIFLVSTAYNFWFLILTGAFFWFGFQKNVNELRTRFFLAYMISWWVGGGLMALAFSSAGPVYYGLLGLAPDPYAPLLAFLNDANTRVPLWVLDVQKLLWDGYQGKSDPVGISAFPSMHNASAIIFALTFSQVSRRVGLIFYGYAAVILLGSISTGWHYAVDGYAGIAIAWASWKLAGVIAKWHSQRAETIRLNESLASL